VLVFAAVLAAACSRDRGRDVAPMTRRQPASPPTSVIMPLDQVSKSQAAIVGQRIANTEITVTYSRPVARGRTLFGGIVPYGEAWDPGADQATAIEVTRGIRIEGHALAAGKYSVWMIPRPDVWTVIFSKAGDTYHTPYPGESQDALRFDVMPRTGPHTETLTFDFPLVEGKDAQLQFRWGTVTIPLRVTVP
jgi:hypothetical protein